jgi:hypothetical protein
MERLGLATKTATGQHSSSESSRGTCDNDLDMFLRAELQSS